MKQLTLLIALLTAFAFCSQALAQTIISEESSVTFSISNYKFNTVDGVFEGVSGTVIFDKDNLSNSSIKACVSSIAISTGNGTRDKHLRTDDFLASETFPDICFTSSSIKKSDTNYIAIGELNLHGITKTVEIPFSQVENTFTGSFVIKRTDFGVGGSGTFMVGDEISIKIVCKIKQD